MTRPSEPVKVLNLRSDAERHTHPAFGYVRVTHPTGRGTPGEMFSSDAAHNEVVRIEIGSAHMERHLSNDWIHDGETHLIMEMTHAQFVQFVSSHSGRITPTTLRFTSLDGHLPAIEGQERKVDQFRGEIQAAARKRLEGIRESLDALSAHIEGPALRKGDLRKIAHTLRGHAEALPSSLGFVVDQAHETLDSMVNDFKVNVEAHLDSIVSRVGAEALREAQKRLAGSEGPKDAIGLQPTPAPQLTNENSED